jgi:hypothetical protein
VLVPAASASRAPRVKIALLPLPKSALGPASSSLPLDFGSGVISNKDSAENTEPLTPTRLIGVPFSGFAKIGRITGYRLDYGFGASGGAGITEVRTGVDEYKTKTGAKTALSYWKKDDRSVTAPLSDKGGLTVADRAEKVAAVGSRRFAFLVGYSAANIAPLFGLDEQFTEGRYEADVTVWAGTAAAAKRLAPALAKKLDRRIKQALAGRLPGKPVRLPPLPKVGPPSGGPDLSTLALKTSDLTGSATLEGQGYVLTFDPSVLSAYAVSIDPAGEFADLGQEIAWYQTANEASFVADFDMAFFGDAPVDLSSVGDGAQAVVENDPTGSLALIVFASGRLSEFVFVESDSAIQMSDVQNVAQSVANYINAAGLGG